MQCEPERAGGLQRTERPDHTRTGRKRGEYDFRGQTSFPYKLQIQGASGVTSGTAYIYLLDSSGNVTSKIEYPGIVFSQVNS